MAFELVTPHQAIEWWDTRERHRKYREPHAQDIAAAMHRGEFRPEDGRPVAIINGKLCNGQHRVRAVIILNRSQTLNVMRVRFA